MIDITDEETGTLTTVKRGPSVLVVGPDGVGKTTVVQHLARMTGIPSFKCPTEKQIFKSHGGAGRQSLVFDYMLTHFLQQTGLRFISDRAYPCEWVYSRVFGRETDRQLLSLIDEMHSNIGTKILYLYSSTQPTVEDDIVPSDAYWDVKKTYDGFCEWTSCQVVALDTARMLQTYLDGGDSSKEFAGHCIGLLGETFR